jgi:hypothetical protein
VPRRVDKFRNILTQWKTLLASNLGLVFDGFETFALILTVGVALRQLLDPSEYTQIPTYAGLRHCCAPTR